MKKKIRREEWSRVKNKLEEEKEDKKEKSVERKKRGKNGYWREGMEVEGATIKE